MLWHQLQWAKYQTDILFDLVLSDSYFASVCITRFFWDPKILSVKLTVAVWLVSLMSLYSEIVTFYCRVIVAYILGCGASYIHAVYKLNNSCFIFENEYQTGSLSRSRTEEFKHCLPFRQKEQDYLQDWLLLFSWVYVVSCLSFQNTVLRQPSKLVG